MKSIKRMSIIFACIYVLLLISIFLFGYLTNANMLWAYVIYGICALLTIILYFAFFSSKKKYNDEINSQINDSTLIALNKGNVGILIYDENFNISFMTDFFKKRNLYRVDEKVLTVFPELDELLSSITLKEVIVINDDKYEVSRKGNERVLIFKDISKEYNLEKELKENAYVLGFANFDNYDESNESEDNIAYVNANIKIPVIEYFKKYNVVYRTIRSNRLQLILSYKQLELLLKDRFSILSIVKDESKKADLDISLSMSFTYGSSDLEVLDKEASILLELAQTRGGDQVIVRQKDKDPIYFGGSSEAKEQKSRVKVRVMVNTIKQLISSSKNVFIVGHKDSDCDCVGSMFGIGAISNAINSETYIVLKDTTIEKTAEEVMYKYEKEIDNDYNLINQDKALDLCDDNSLIIMCDHHTIDQSNCADLLKKGNRILVIDHHRRKADLEYNASLLYLEASASSTCEMVTEFFNFVNNVKPEEYLANIMYLGIIIDTNHFKARVSSRTFDAARKLKEYGADSQLCEELSQETFSLIKERTEIINNAEYYDYGVIISAIHNDEHSRTLASQACDALVETKGTNAAFVICKTSKDTVIVSARSNGKINVQLILEGMHGGGHMTSAGLQRQNESVDDVRKELIENIDKYFNESVEKDESNTTK